jgi:hypothetical protein
MPDTSKPTNIAATATVNISFPPLARCASVKGE